MKEVLFVIGLSICLAYCTQHGIGRMYITRRITVDVPLVAMVVILGLFCGLRTSYNDTWTYIQGFQNAPTPAELWSDGIDLLENPLYYGFQSVFRHMISENYHSFLLVIALFTAACFVSFIRRYAVEFTFSIFLYFTLGLYLFSFAAIKQCLAMAILTLAVRQLLERHYVRFYLILLIAMLFHAYAIFFVILPLFLKKPWSPITYLTIALTLLILFNFEPALSALLDYAEEAGKQVSEELVFDTEGINIFRVAVFSVPPLLSFLFRRRLNPGMTEEISLMLNMSILSFLVMCLGLSSGANLFGRSAIYFEIGAIIGLPYIIRTLFTPQSARVVRLAAVLCYMFFFLYGTEYFSAEFQRITLWEYLLTL